MLTLEKGTEEWESLKRQKREVDNHKAYNVQTEQAPRSILPFYGRRKTEAQKEKPHSK